MRGMFSTGAPTLSASIAPLGLLWRRRGARRCAPSRASRCGVFRCRPCWTPCRPSRVVSPVPGVTEGQTFCCIQSSWTPARKAPLRAERRTASENTQCPQRRTTPGTTPPARPGLARSANITPAAPARTARPTRRNDHASTPQPPRQPHARPARTRTQSGHHERHAAPRAPRSNADATDTTGATPSPPQQHRTKTSPAARPARARPGPGRSPDGSQRLPASAETLSVSPRPSRASRTPRVRLARDARPLRGRRRIGIVSDDPHATFEARQGRDATGMTIASGDRRRSRREPHRWASRSPAATAGPVARLSGRVRLPPVRRMRSAGLAPLRGSCENRERRGTVGASAHHSEGPHDLRRRLFYSHQQPAPVLGE